MRYISLYICDPNFSCGLTDGLTDGLTKVFHEALADLKTDILRSAFCEHCFGVFFFYLRLWFHVF